jgi:hypothetical protein
LTSDPGRRRVAGRERSFAGVRTASPLFVPERGHVRLGIRRFELWIAGETGSAGMGVGWWLDKQSHTQPWQDKEGIMGRDVGVWIDHRKAMIASVTDKGEELGLVISKAERQLRRTGDSPLKGRSEPEKEPMSDSRQRRFTAHLNVYYDAVIAALRDARRILICGPGEAKGELKKRLVRAKLGARVLGVETADKMTEHQLAKKVRGLFARE